MASPKYTFSPEAHFQTNEPMGDIFLQPSLHKDVMCQLVDIIIPMSPVRSRVRPALHL